MILRSNDEGPQYELPGLQHRTLAGAAQGLRGVEVWEQVMTPGAQTPFHRHDCEEVIVVLSGSGRCECDGRTVDFAAPSTLIMPPDQAHQITAVTRLHLIASLTMTPVVVQTPEGAPIPLPWG